VTTSRGSTSLSQLQNNNNHKKKQQHKKQSNIKTTTKKKNEGEREHRVSIDLDFGIFGFLAGDFDGVGATWAST
jgi:hypothetical protein